MNKTLALGGAMSLLSCPTMAQAIDSPKFYSSIGYSHVDDSTFDFDTVGGRVGAQFNPHLGVEVEGSLGVNGDDFQVSAGGGAKRELDYDLAVYAVGRQPLTDRFALLARVGYGVTRFETTSVTIGRTDDRNSWNYGVGAQFDLDDHNGLRADWTRREFKGDGSADVYSVSYVRRF